MKNYNLVFRVFATMFKWFSIDITLRPGGDILFKFSVDYKTKCSMPGVYVNFAFLKLINMWVSVFDERILNETTQKLYSPVSCNPKTLTKKQKNDSDGLLGDLIYMSPRFDQMFHRYNNLPASVITYKRQFSELSNDMEKHLREISTTNP